jgi:hypothetical protein
VATTLGVLRGAALILEQCQKCVVEIEAEADSQILVEEMKIHLGKEIAISRCLRMASLRKLKSLVISY